MTGLMLGWLSWLALGLWWSFAPQAACRFYAAFGQRWSSDHLRPLGWVALVVFVFGEGAILIGALDRVGR